MIIKVSRIPLPPPPPPPPTIKVEMEMTRDEAVVLRASLGKLNATGPAYSLFCYLADTLEKP